MPAAGATPQPTQAPGYDETIDGQMEQKTAGDASGKSASVVRRKNRLPLALIGGAVAASVVLAVLGASRGWGFQSQQLGRVRG